MKPVNLDYHLIIVAFSGGKDSLACILHLLEQGVPRERIELWHHDVDGHGDRFMDWPVTTEYCRAVAKALGLPIRYSWREGGFKREMLRQGTATAPVAFETSKEVVRRGGDGPPGTRLKFPAISANLAVRWCSAALKVDVGRRVFTNDWRFENGKFLLVTGERAEESSARAKYDEWDEHASSTRKRLVHQWRPILRWREEEVWNIIEKWRVRPHPGYYLGWGRISCMFCIFGDKNQWASARALDPKGFRKIAGFEEDFGHTIKQGISVEGQADQGRVFLPARGPLWDLAMSESYPEEMALLPKGETWQLPAGAYKRAGGPS
jgi:3'-phosphoadenosine 5'-phosphosulfate sulfotransferase (PAPS reductase)/FAD synthetase